MEKQPLLNTYVNNMDMAETIQTIGELIAAGKNSYVVPINVDVVMKMESDSYLKEIINHADMVLVDGKPLIWISKWHGCPVKAKISGSDLVPLLCKNSAKTGDSIFILGGREGIAKKAKRNLRRDYP